MTTPQRVARAAMAVILAAAAGLAAGRLLGPEHGRTGEARTTAPSPGASTLPEGRCPARASEPPHAGSDPAALPAAPPGVSWTSIGIVPVPVSPTAGPLRRSGPVWSCYAHTPMGAVIAAHVIPALLLTGHWRTVVDQAVVHDAGRTAFLRASAHQPRAHLSPGQIPTPEGFHILA